MDNNRELSSVEWLFHNIVEDQMIRAKSSREWLEIFVQAKEKHEEETVRLYTDYEDYLDEAFNYQNGGQAKIKTFREFYNETFNNNKL